MQKAVDASKILRAPGPWSKPGAKKVGAVGRACGRMRIAAVAEVKVKIAQAKPARIKRRGLLCAALKAPAAVKVRVNLNSSKIAAAKINPRHIKAHNRKVLVCKDKAALRANKAQGAGSRILKAELNIILERRALQKIVNRGINRSCGFGRKLA